MPKVAPEWKGLSLCSWFEECAVRTNLSIGCNKWELYAFFWVIPRCRNFVCRCFGTLRPFRLQRWVGVSTHTYPPMKTEQTECSETSAYKIQTPGNYPEESIQHSEHSESLRSSGSCLTQKWKGMIRIRQRLVIFIVLYTV